jgi:hypothetical protein
MARHRSLSALTAICIGLAALLAACSSTNAGGVAKVATATTAPTATPTATATATPVPPCVQLVPGATPFTSVPNVPGLQLPPGAYISPATHSGGGTGQYSITTYTICYQGSEYAIDGGPYSTPPAPNSTLVVLGNNGWITNNLFPDPSNFVYLDYCSAPHVCVNSSGSPNPFTFVGFDQFISAGGGYETVRMEVGTIGAPACLNNSSYYSGTPKYTIYEDGSKASSSNPTYHFQMPPGTRVSTFQGGGTAGSTYTYFCSDGTAATVLADLKTAMTNDGWSITNPSATDFTATTTGNCGNPPHQCTYQIYVNVTNPNNYYLRVFIPM